MPQLPEPTPEKRTRHRRRQSWLAGKISRIKKSTRAKRQLLQMVIIIAAMLIAFILGFYYFGPSFTTSAEQ